MRFADLDAVTVDGYGPLFRLVDPVPSLRRALADRGVDCSADAAAAGFAAEVADYRPNALLRRDPDSLAALRLECARILLQGAAAGLPAPPSVAASMAATVLEPIPGAFETVRALRA